MKRGTPEHPKTKHLARALGLERWGAVGVLESLWHFTAKFAPRGDIGRFSDDDIADGIGWTCNIKALVPALVETRWLDACKTNRLVVHDWPVHADDAVKKLLARNGLQFAVVATCLDSVATCLDKVEPRDDNNCLPEPLPLPEDLFASVPVATKRKRQTRPKGGNGSVSWLAPVLEAWTATMGGQLSPGRAGHAFASMYDQATHTYHDRVLEAWQNYLAKHGGEQARFASPEDFASKWATWLPQQSEGDAFWDSLPLFCEKCQRTHARGKNPERCPFEEATA